MKDEKLFAKYFAAALKVKVKERYDTDSAISRAIDIAEHALAAHRERFPDKVKILPTIGETQTKTAAEVLQEMADNLAIAYKPQSFMLKRSKELHNESKRLSKNRDSQGPTKEQADAFLASLRSFGVHENDITPMKKWLARESEDMLNDNTRIALKYIEFLESRS